MPCIEVDILGAGRRFSPEMANFRALRMGGLLLKIAMMTMRVIVMAMIGMVMIVMMMILVMMII